LLAISKASGDAHHGASARETLLQRISSRTVLLNIVILIGNCAALTAWYAIYRMARSERMQTASVSPLPSSIALESVSLSSPAMSPRPSDLQLRETSTAPVMLLPGSLTWPEVFSNHAGSNFSKSGPAAEVVLEANNPMQYLQFLSFGSPRPVQVPRPALTSYEYGRLAPVIGPRRRPTIERWGWIPVSHTELFLYGVKLAADITNLVQTLSGDTASEIMAGRLAFLNDSRANPAWLHAMIELEASNLWMYVSPPVDRGMDVASQF
jgi:hypothetical protein